MSGLLYLDLHTNKVCMGFSTSHCCDNPVVELKRFEVNVVRDGDPNANTLIVYPMFEVNDQNQMCVLLDGDMSKLCNGRYLFRVMFDKCVVVAEVPFMWGGKPVLTSVDVEASSGASTPEGCFSDFEAGLETGPKMPETCCKPCEPECSPQDPCSQCKPKCCE